ncbi:MAG: SDR family oxidoreductase [Hyphomicrobiales bacterium]|nr:MAG: SDR family oxidoreductase [Hyphomicrobiales bacterium]
MIDIKGKIAWVTGAGTGIGEAGALALAREGAVVVLTGRRREPLDKVAAAITKASGIAHVKPADLTKVAEVNAIALWIKETLGRLDILVNNAGLNIPDRSWSRLTPEGIDKVIGGNLSSAFYVTHAVLPMMRAQGGGLLIHTASWAGRFVGPVPGGAYIAAKHGMVAMSHSLNLEECMNGIRSTVLCPGEVATPIMTERPIPETPESLARMVQPEDMGEIIAFVAKQPPHVVINEMVMSPTHNRGYINQVKARQAQAAAAGKGAM